MFIKITSTILNLILFLTGIISFFVEIPSVFVSALMIGVSTFSLIFIFYIQRVIDSLVETFKTTDDMWRKANKLL